MNKKNIKLCKKKENKTKIRLESNKTQLHL